MKKVKQGHTKFKVSVCKPGTFSDYEDCWVALVYTCFATEVNGTTVRYSTESGAYFCGAQFWQDKLFSTRRKALRHARERIDAINRENGYL